MPRTADAPSGSPSPEAPDGPTFEEDALALRVYLSETDRAQGEPLYKLVVKTQREEWLWGATAIRGLYGYGKRSRLHTAAPLRLSTDLPLVIEAIDRPDKIRATLPRICALVHDGLVTLEPVGVVPQNDAE